MVDFLGKAAKPMHSCTHWVSILCDDDISYFHFPSGMSCSKDKFSCADGGCVSWTQTCNGQKNCEDGTDEPLFCRTFPGT